MPQINLVLATGDGPDSRVAFLAENAGALAQKHETCRWLDISNENFEQERLMLSTLALEPRDLELCLDRRRFPSADLVPSGLALRLPLRNATEDETAIFLTLVLVQNVVITLHRSPLFSLEKLRQTLMDNKRPQDEDWPKNGMELLAFLLAGIMEEQVGLFLDARTNIEILADRQEDDPRSAPAHLILGLKHQVAHLVAQCEDQFYCFTVARSKLARANAPQGLRDFVGDQIQDSEHLQKSLHRLESRLGDMLHLAEGLLHTKTEQRVRTLTVISAIFMPLTLLTGIYGMNFSDMPVLQQPGAFNLLLATMGTLAAGMIAFFAWRGWFK